MAAQSGANPSGCSSGVFHKRSHERSRSTTRARARQIRHTQCARNLEGGSLRARHGSPALKTERARTGAWAARCSSARQWRVRASRPSSRGAQDSQSRRRRALSPARAPAPPQRASVALVCADQARRLSSAKGGVRAPARLRIPGRAQHTLPGLRPRRAGSACCLRGASAPACYL